MVIFLKKMNTAFKKIFERKILILFLLGSPLPRKNTSFKNLWIKVLIQSLWELEVALTFCLAILNELLSGCNMRILSGCSEWQMNLNVSLNVIS
ncbi:Uncharacterised protein [Mycobacteroides abscessus subsp. abscessus]|nr:Uncharacterised protein [Mycobacteroides abscessus subsp. abscessus]